MTEEEILTPLGLRPSSPDHLKGWTTTLPDRTERMPLPPPVTVTSFTRTDTDTRFQGNNDFYDNISLRYRGEFPSIPLFCCVSSLSDRG